jgi:putative alpha-1,2-mannosidase
VLVGEELPAKAFKGYFVARFSEAFSGEIGVSSHGRLEPGITTGSGEVLSGYVTFASDVKVVDVRVGVSFISIDQARR